FMPLEHAVRLLVLVVARDDMVRQVRSIEVPDEDFGRLKPELGDDIGPHLLGRSGGEGVNRGLWKVFLQLAQLAIFGTEVMSPMADAVGLVDGEPPHADLLEKRAKSACRQPFGGRKQKPDRTAHGRLFTGP